MNTRAEIVERVEDFQKGRLGVIPPHALMPYVRDDTARVEHTGI